MHTVNWSGVLPAIVTPFAANGSLDKAALRDLTDLLLREGVSGFVVGGSTGEYYSMTLVERVDLFQTAMEHVAGRATLIAGTSSVNHAETLELTKHAKQLGYAGCMVLPPVYCLPTPPEIIGAFTEIDAVGLPVMVYNNPARAGVACSPSLMVELARLPNIVAYKESARDLYISSEIYYATRDHLRHFAGLEPYASALIPRGAHGIVSTIANVCGREVVQYYQACLAADTDALARNQQVIDQMYHLLAHSGLSNYAFAKTAMAALGRPGGYMRRPHHMGDAAQTTQIRTEIQAIYARAGIPMHASV